MCITIYIFNFKKHKTNKQKKTRIKKAKETKEEKRISPENCLKKTYLRKVLGAKSYVYRSYRGKTGRKRGLFAPPPPILSRVKVDFQICDVRTWETRNCNTHIAQYLKK